MLFQTALFTIGVNLFFLVPMLDYMLTQDMQVLNQVLLINKHYNPEFNKKYQEEFDNYRMAYESVRRE